MKEKKNMQKNSVTAVKKTETPVQKIIFNCQKPALGVWLKCLKT